MTYTYIPVTLSDDIPIEATTFIHFYNGSASNDNIVFSGRGITSATITLLAGEELFVGRFDIDTYGPTITVTHTHASGVVMAAVTSGNTPIQNRPADNLSDVTLEFIIKLDTLAATAVLLGKRSSDLAGWFGVEVHTNGSLLIHRYTTNGNYDAWTSGAGIFTTNTWHSIEMTWASSTGPTSATAPTLEVNDADYTFTHTNTGTGNWADDTGTQILLGSDGIGATIDGSILLFKLHTEILTREERRENYLHDKWRYEGMGETSIETISPHVSVDFEAAWAYAPHVEAGEIEVLAPSFGELSTVVNLGTLECGGTETLFVITPTDITVHPTTITTTMAIFDLSSSNNVNIDVPVEIFLDGIIDDEVELDGVIDDEITLDGLIDDEIEMDGVVV